MPYNNDNVSTKCLIEFRDLSKILTGIHYPYRHFDTMVKGK